MKLSFILPCYNVERYVLRCLDSIYAIQLANTDTVQHTDWTFEVICLNDASKDSTGKILEEYAFRHSNLHFIDLPKNKGWGAVRNIGTSIAKGEYVWFVDSDDTIVSDAVPGLLRHLEQNQSEVACINFYDVDEKGDRIRDYQVFTEVNSMNGIEFVRQCMGNKFVQNIGYVWRFLYKRSFLQKNKLLFPEGVCWEDTIYVPQALVCAKSVSSTDMFGYEYWHHQSSVCQTFRRAYPGKLLYEFVFFAGVGLYDYAQTVSDEFVCQELTKLAISDYFGKLPLFLCRQTFADRRDFYVCQRGKKFKTIACYNSFPILSKVLLLPVVGCLIADVLSVIYKMTHLR